MIWDVAGIIAGSLMVGFALGFMFAPTQVRTIIKYVPQVPDLSGHGNDLQPGGSAVLNRVFFTKIARLAEVTHLHKLDDFKCETMSDAVATLDVLTALSLAHNLDLTKHDD